MPIKGECGGKIFFENDKGEWEILNKISTIDNLSDDTDDELTKELEYAGEFVICCPLYAKNIHKVKGRTKKRLIKMMYQLMYDRLYSTYALPNNWLKRHGYPMRRKTYEQRNKYR